MACCPDSLRVAHYPEQIGLEAGIKMLGSCGSCLDGWLRPCPNPHHQTQTNTVHLPCTDHTYWQELSACTSARWGSLCMCLVCREKKSDQGTAVRMERSAVSFSCHAGTGQFCVCPFDQFLSHGRCRSCLLLSLSPLAPCWPWISCFILFLPTFCLIE